MPRAGAVEPSWSLLQPPDRCTLLLDAAYRSLSLHSRSSQVYAEQEPSLLIKYIYSYYWSLATMSTIGYGDLIPTTDPERDYAIFVMLFSALVRSAHARASSAASLAVALTLTLAFTLALTLALSLTLSLTLTLALTLILTLTLTPTP